MADDKLVAAVEWVDPDWVGGILAAGAQSPDFRVPVPEDDSTPLGGEALSIPQPFQGEEPVTPHLLRQ